ncbi:MAG: cupin domain-containing protein [Muribaculaceae bacterium]|nr:cupin domain-containing protein [Muribaculaceae bacterium]
MKTVSKISEGTNYSAVSLGTLDSISEYVLPIAPGIEIPGKVFIGQSLKATGGEISFQSFAPGSETGFLHTHKNHEELYIFVSGTGEFQVDSTNFTVGEGSVVRVAPNGKRTVRNTGNTPLVMICVQYRGNTFTAEDATDGVILQEKVNW